MNARAGAQRAWGFAKPKLPKPTQRDLSRRFVRFLVQNARKAKQFYVRNPTKHTLQAYEDSMRILKYAYQNRHPK